MPLVGDREKEAAVTVLRRAYVEGYLDELELEQRLDRALRARTATQLAQVVRAIPGGLGTLVLHGVVLPAVRRRTLPIRIRAARVLLKLAVSLWAASTVILGLVAGVLAILAALSADVGAVLLIVWLALTALALRARRTARRLIRLP